MSLALGDVSVRKLLYGISEIFLPMFSSANSNHNDIPSHTSQSGQHKQINKQMLERMWRKGNPSTLLVGMQTGEATVENNTEFPQKTNNGTAL